MSELDRKTVEQAAADKLDRLYKEFVAAHHALNDATTALEAADERYRRAKALYRRQALWIKADEHRKRAEEAEAEARGITLENPDA